MSGNPSWQRLGVFRRIVPWILPVAILVIWQIAADNGWITRRTAPPPSGILEAALRLSKTGELWTNILISCERAGIGLLIGGSLGFAFGLVNGLSHGAELTFDTTLQMLRNIPHLAIIPMVILWFGIGENAKLFLVAAGVFFPMYINTYHGVRQVEPSLVEMARIYRLGPLPLFWRVIIPGALPSILLGLRYALAIMWLTLIVAETISSTSGIGYMTMNAREFLQTDVVLLGILIYAILGKAADIAARALERLCLPWHPSYRVADDGVAR